MAVGRKAGRYVHIYMYIFRSRTGLRFLKCVYSVDVDKKKLIDLFGSAVGFELGYRNLGSGLFVYL